MAESISKLVDKVSSYQLFNYIFPGIIMVEGTEAITNIKFPGENIWFRVFIYYLTGMILSRIGSLIIEPLYKRLTWVVYARYSNYLKALEKDQKLDILVKENNTYRTLLATFITMLIIFVLDQFSWFSVFTDSLWSTIVYFVLLVVIFSIAYHKQTSFVRSRAHYNVGLKDSEELPKLKEEQRKRRKK